LKEVFSSFKEPSNHPKKGGRGDIAHGGKKRGNLNFWGRGFDILEN